MPTNTLKVKKRSLFLLITYSVLIVALMVRIGYYQIVMGEEYSKMAYEKQTRSRIINPKRGTIYDRNGKELAISASVETISVNPQDFKDKMKDTPEKIDEIAADLGRILDMDPQVVRDRLTSNSVWSFIKRKVEKEVGTQVREYLLEKGITSIYVDEDSKRFYPNGTLAAHVLGFTGDDEQGLNGIEKTFDKELKGQSGMVMSEFDAGGRQVKYSPETYVEPVNGYDLYLTIDETIQYFTEKALEKAMLDYNLKRGAAAIVMDPKTGYILAMASKPDYDPNDPFSKPDFLGEEIEWKGKASQDDVNLLFQTVFRNKALMDTYEPGSTFKALTGAAALEEGVVTPDTIVYCDGSIQIGDAVINCATGPHGSITVSDAIAHSWSMPVGASAQNQ